MVNVTDKLPLVSICIPTYNSEKYIVKMLATIAAQTYKNIEVIISDNNSTDRTFEILENYTKELNWKLLRNKVNIGALNNMSVLVKAATGKYVAIYHADDLYANDIVEKSVNILEQDERVGMVSTMGYSIDADDKILSTFELPQNFRDKKRLPFAAVFSEILSQRPFFLITPSVITRAAFYQENPSFNTKYRSAADYGKWFEILQKSDLFILDEKLISYRTHENQGSQLEIKQNYNIPDSIALYRDYTKTNLTLFEEKFSYSYYKLMFVQAIKLNNNGQFQRSQRFIKLILKYGPKSVFPIVFLLVFFNKIKAVFSLTKLMAIKKIIRK